MQYVAHNYEIRSYIIYRRFGARDNAARELSQITSARL